MSHTGRGTRIVPPLINTIGGTIRVPRPVLQSWGYFFRPLTLRMLIYNHFQKIRASGETFKKITAFIVVKIAKGEHFLKVLFLKA